MDYFILMLAVVGAVFFTGWLYRRKIVKLEWTIKEYDRKQEEGEFRLRISKQEEGEFRLRISKLEYKIKRIGEALNDDKLPPISPTASWVLGESPRSLHRTGAGPGVKPKIIPPPKGKD